MGDSETANIFRQFMCPKMCIRGVENLLYSKCIFLYIVMVNFDLGCAVRNLNTGEHKNMNMKIAIIVGFKA
jgi:hypothetical protein